MVAKLTSFPRVFSHFQGSQVEFYCLKRHFHSERKGNENGNRLNLAGNMAAIGTHMNQHPITNDVWFPPLPVWFRNGSRVHGGGRDNRIIGSENENTLGRH